MAFKREFLYFQYGFQESAAISLYCIQYYEYDHYFFYSFAAYGILLILLMNQKIEQQTIWNEILCDRRRTIMKKIRQNEKLSMKKELVGIKLVGQTYGGNISYGE